MKALIQRFRILFDRTFAAQGWKQLAWLVAAILLVFIIGWLLHFLFISGATYNDLSGLSWHQRLFQLLIDPGAVDYVSADHHLVAQILALIGTILFLQQFSVAHSTSSDSCIFSAANI